jgi:hypothetical protein
MINPLPSSTLRLSLTSKANKLASSFGAEHVRIVVVLKRSTLQRIGDVLMGHPNQYKQARLLVAA